jgi:hypothetical protein
MEAQVVKAGLLRVVEAYWEEERISSSWFALPLASSQKVETVLVQGSDGKSMEVVDLRRLEKAHAWRAVLAVFFTS